MQEVASFDTDCFPPVLSDECQPNPGVIGFELCWYFVQELAKRGIDTEYPQAEDWAWYVTFGVDVLPQFNLYIRSPFEEEPEWKLILEPLVHGLFKKQGPPKDAELPLLNALK